MSDADCVSLGRKEEEGTLKAHSVPMLLIVHYWEGRRRKEHCIRPDLDGCSRYFSHLGVLVFLEGSQRTNANEIWLRSKFDMFHDMFVH